MGYANVAVYRGQADWQEAGLPGERGGRGSLSGFGARRVTCARNEGRRLYKYLPIDDPESLLDVEVEARSPPGATCWWR
jgi:hypothetical protein